MWPLELLWFSQACSAVVHISCRMIFLYCWTYFRILTKHVQSLLLWADCEQSINQAAREWNLSLKMTSDSSLTVFFVVICSCAKRWGHLAYFYVLMFEKEDAVAFTFLRLRGEFHIAKAVSDLFIYFFFFISTAEKNLLLNRNPVMFHHTAWLSKTKKLKYI